MEVASRSRGHLLLLTCCTLLCHCTNGFMVERAFWSPHLQSALHFTIMEVIITSSIALLFTLGQFCFFLYMLPWHKRFRAAKLIRMNLSVSFLVLMGVVFCVSLMLTNQTTVLLSFPVQVLFKSTKVIFVASLRHFILSRRGRGEGSSSYRGVWAILPPCIVIFVSLTTLILISPPPWQSVAAAPPPTLSGAIRVPTSPPPPSQSPRSVLLTALGIVTVVVSNSMDAVLYGLQEFWCFAKRGDASAARERVAAPVCCEGHSSSPTEAPLAAAGADGSEGHGNSEAHHQIFRLHVFHEIFLATNLVACGLLLVLYTLSRAVSQGKPMELANVCVLFPTLLCASVSGTLGTLCLFTIVRDFNSTTAVVVTNLRKAVSVFASYFIFYGHFTLLQATGVLGVLGGCLWYEVKR